MGVFGFMVVEKLSLADALYFSIVTMATVGYGDIHPASPVGKFLAVILIVGGVGTFLGVVANASELLIAKREFRMRMQKLHVIIGLFFSEAGTALLRYFTSFDAQISHIKRELLVSNNWSNEKFAAINKRLEGHEYNVDVKQEDLTELRNYLLEKGNLLLRLLENPLLLEHESFTELLIAVFHLREELISRENLEHLPEKDILHLAGDIKRVYVSLAHQWLDYMKYLKDHYPYLFSMAMRMNPFDTAASPVVR
jgi:hypothetical protein